MSSNNIPKVLLCVTSVTLLAAFIYLRSQTHVSFLCFQTGKEYLDKLVNMAKGTNMNTNRDALEGSSLAFDGLWGIVTAINNSIEDLAALNITISMEDNVLRSRKIELQQHLFNKMKHVDFEGIAVSLMTVVVVTVVIVMGIVMVMMP